MMKKRGRPDEFKDAWGFYLSLNSGDSDELRKSWDSLKFEDKEHYHKLASQDHQRFVKDNKLYV